MSIAIYMEGGGDGGSGRSALRRGMDMLLNSLKGAARDKAIRWKTVCCGPRNEAFKRFRKAIEDGYDDAVVLLVDAETPVTGSPRDHLQTLDRWELGFAADDAVHLMVQTMETWIVADPETLREYYGQGFNAGALPRRPNLEEEPKASVEDSLERATAGTQKGRYHKIRHASDLLQWIDPETVKARCRHCDRLFIELGRLIDAA